MKNITLLKHEFTVLKCLQLNSYIYIKLLDMKYMIVSLSAKTLHLLYIV